MSGVKHMQLLMRNPMFKSKRSNSGNQGQIYGKAKIVNKIFVYILKQPLSVFENKLMS